jgi:hypothetical protein
MFSADVPDLSTFSEAVVSDPVQPGQLQPSPFRSFGFDFAVIVLLSAADYAVAKASKCHATWSNPPRPIDST